MPDSSEKGSIHLEELVPKPTTQSNPLKSLGVIKIYLGVGIQEQTASLYARELSDAGIAKVISDAAN